MPSKVDVANFALQLVGATRITSFTQGTPSANAVNELYDETRRELLRKHNWNFATKRQKLGRSSTTPTFEFTYANVMPSDWLKTISVHNNDAGTGTMYHRIEQVAGQRVVVSDEEDVYLRYIADIEDPNMFTSDFRLALSQLLAARLSISLTESNTLRDELKREAKLSVNNAMSNDSIDAFPETRPRGSWIDSRSGWPTRNWGTFNR